MTLEARLKESWRIKQWRKQLAEQGHGPWREAWVLHSPRFFNFILPTKICIQKSQFRPVLVIVEFLVQLKSVLSRRKRSLWKLLVNPVMLSRTKHWIYHLCALWSWANHGTPPYFINSPDNDTDDNNVKDRPSKPVLSIKWEYLSENTVST